jgi:protein-L-isoaspartate(D-aspartate) O-methyltransferase
MWRNQEVRGFVDWLRDHNKGIAQEKRVAFRGLDLYSLYNSIRCVLDYLDDVDPEAARIARTRYGCLTPWQSDPASYGRATLNKQYRSCEEGVVRMLTDIMAKHNEYAEHDSERFLSAEQNARLVANAERYYRIMYYGSRASWNLRDSYMFNTLRTLLDYHGSSSKAIVWAHNSHVGDSQFMEMSARGEYNIGHLCRQTFGSSVYAIGFGTHSGEVAAASDWDGPMEIKTVQPSLSGSYERVCHDVGMENFLLPLGTEATAGVDESLKNPRLERAIGVIYRPETERQSHYFQAILPGQFDEYVWFDNTHAVTPLHTSMLQGLPDTYPFGI